MALPILLRDARPADAAQAAPLVHAAAPTLYNLMFGPRPEAVIGLFEALFALPANPFSYDCALVAEGPQGRLLGVALAAEVGRRRAGGRRMAWLLPRCRNPLLLLPLLPNIWNIMACSTAPPADAYYLSCLAVASTARGQGIGSQLIAEVHRRGEAAGCGRVALHTEMDNRAAQRFYSRHGYRATAEKPAGRLRRYGVAGLTAMERPLVGPV